MNGLIVTDQVGNTYTYIYDTVAQQFTLTPVSNVSPSTADNSISTNALQLITSALRLIKVVASGESPSNSELTDGLMVLNQMIDSWNAERLSIFTTSASDYALAAGRQVYTLGPGGYWNTNRPAQIDAMSAVLLSNPSNPIELPINYTSNPQDWQNVAVKNVNGSFPLMCYDDGGFPLRTLSFWPTPTTSLNTIRVYSWQPLALASTLLTTIALPPGYARALRYNLAVDLASEFDAELSNTVAAVAVRSKAVLKTMNAPDMSMKSDFAATNIGNEVTYLFGLPFVGPR